MRLQACQLAKFVGLIVNHVRKQLVVEVEADCRKSRLESAGNRRLDAYAANAPRDSNICSGQADRIGEFDVAGNVLPIGQITQRQLARARARAADCPSPGLRRAWSGSGGWRPTRRIARQLGARPCSRGAAQNQVNFIRLGFGQERLQFLNLHLVVRAAAGGVDQNQVEIGQTAEGLPASRPASRRLPSADR